LGIVQNVHRHLKFVPVTLLAAKIGLREEGKRKVVDHVDVTIEVKKINRSSLLNNLVRILVGRRKGSRLQFRFKLLSVTFPISSGSAKKVIQQEL